MKTALINRFFSILLLILITIGILQGCRIKDTSYADNGSVASAHPLATKAGMDILEKGGNAFDAAIAVAACLNVIEPMMSGLGGYGTILIYDSKESNVRFLNPSGRFPQKDQYRPYEGTNTRFHGKQGGTEINFNTGKP